MGNKNSGALIAPSILSADFAQLGDQVREVEKAGADWIHVDVMDGHFVPNLTIGPLVVKALRPVTRLPLDCHLMVAKPEDWVDGFVAAGADGITIHAEATKDLKGLLKKIRGTGKRVGVSISPPTPLSAIESVLDLVDLVLIMSVNPGFGGQKFIAESTDKIKALAKLRGAKKFIIEVDGGVSAENIRELRDAGTDVFVAGSSVFGGNAIAKNMEKLRKALL